MLSVETVGVGLVGYLLGSIPFGVIIAKKYGIDIFSVGSGNPGATNCSDPLVNLLVILFFS